MNKKAKIYDEIFSFSKRLLTHQDCFVCVYGSYACDHYSNESDLDMFVATKNYNAEDFIKIRDFVIALHIKNGLKIDEEIPYENKLLITYKDIADATTLAPFIKEGKYLIPPIMNDDKELLASRDVRLRLILNALTTPHHYIYGNKVRYVEYRNQVEKAIIALARGLLHTKNPSSGEIIKTLLRQ